MGTQWRSQTSVSGGVQLPPLFPLTSFLPPIPVSPFFPYLHITSVLPRKVSVISGHSKSVSFPSGSGRSPAAKQFLVHFEVKIARCAVAPLLTVALKYIRLERGYNRQESNCCAPGLSQ